MKKIGASERKNPFQRYKEASERRFFFFFR